MKLLLKLTLILAVLCGGGAAAYNPTMDYWKHRNLPEWRTAAVETGTIVEVKNSTGTVKPVLSVSVGSFVSGPIVELNVDFNDIVKKDEVLAKVDPRLFAANVERDGGVKGVGYEWHCRAL